MFYPGKRGTPCKPIQMNFFDGTTPKAFILFGPTKLNSRKMKYSYQEKYQ